MLETFKPLLPRLRYSMVTRFPVAKAAQKDYELPHLSVKERALASRKKSESAKVRRQSTEGLHLDKTPAWATLR